VKGIATVEGAIVVVDDADWPLLAMYDWRLDKDGYSRRQVRGVGVEYMHRRITDAQKGEMVDHINGERLDNRRCNLRLCSPQQNPMNRGKSPDRWASPYRGVHRAASWKDGSLRWQAQLQISGKRIHIGIYATDKEAAKAYDEFARRAYGEFARLNFPNEADA
jgi:hypothetical protein